MKPTTRLRRKVTPAVRTLASAPMLAMYDAVLAALTVRPKADILPTVERVVAQDRAPLHTEADCAIFNVIAALHAEILEASASDGRARVTFRNWGAEKYSEAMRHFSRLERLL